jgi:predicted small lipoprotein YifL
MHTMKSLFGSLLLLGALAGIAGCGQPPLPKSGTNAKDTKSVDPWKKAVELFHQTENMRAGDEWSRFRSGCEQVKGHFAKTEVLKTMRERSSANRAFLESEVHLNADELADVESPSFRGPDAHHLDECYLLADVAKALETTGLTPPLVAETSFRWAMRNVLPHEQGDSWTPPACTLRRGYGSPLERALVFLALLRQAQGEGCLIVVPEGNAEPKQILAAFHDPADSKLYLFDPRLGLPLMGKDGKSVLTLKEALADPALLKPALITEAQAKQLQAWLVCPLYALPARMHELQRVLTSRGESVVLYLDAAELARDIAKASGLTVKVWNQPATAKTAPNSPTRSLRQFLPSREGGIDESNRLPRFQRARLPIENVRANLAQINLRRGDLLPGPAYDMLLGLTEQLVNQYDLQAREMLLRGDYGAVSRRQERLQLFARNEALDRLVGDAKFAKEVEEWRQEVIKANVDDKVKAFMLLSVGQDLYLRLLIDITKEEKLDSQFKMGVITRILAVAIREHLAAELAYAQDSGNHEKADHAQTLLRAPKATPEQKAEAHDAWIIAKNSWENYYLETFVLQAKLKQKLRQLQTVRADNQLERIDKQVSLLETVHLDVQEYFSARLRLAECIEHAQGAPAARVSRLATKAQLEALKKEGLLAAEIRRLEGAPPDYRRRLDLLARDWSEQGNYFWLNRQIEQLTADAGKK